MMSGSICTRFDASGFTRLVRTRFSSDIERELCLKSFPLVLKMKTWDVADIIGDGKFLCGVFVGCGNQSILLDRNIDWSANFG